MGSIEVYDYKQQKWVPSNPDPEVVYQHFKDLRDGYVYPDHLGRYHIGSGQKFRKLDEPKEKQPVVKLVTPVAQATEIAESEIRRNNVEDNACKKQRKRKNTTETRPSKKRRYTHFNSEFSV